MQMEKCVCLMSTPKLHIVHAVRRYGPVGGMERYVWELTRALSEAGHRIIVVCEACCSERPPGIEVHELGQVTQRPRWLALIRFSRRVSRWVKGNPESGWLIHSHERLAVHDVTTFHGPPFATIRGRPWWRRVSLRIQMQLYLEKRELCTARVKAVVPNSQWVSTLLRRYYPCAPLAHPIAPGVTPGPVRPARLVPSEGGVIGFVGREWNRKGLDLAAEIVRELRRLRPHLEFLVIGPDPEEVRHLFADWKGGYHLMGWSNDTGWYANMDLLLHPARAEPYGMAIGEAMAARVPVVISDRCGIAPDVGEDSGEVLGLDRGLSHWITACERQLSRTDSPSPLVRSWQTVAGEYLKVYQSLMR